jgi:hypothetical protein
MGQLHTLMADDYFTAALLIIWISGHACVAARIVAGKKLDTDGLRELPQVVISEVGRACGLRRLIRTDTRLFGVQVRDEHPGSADEQGADLVTATALREKQ